MSTPQCGALGWWGTRRFLCELDPHDAAGMHENNAEVPGVIWFGDHTPPCTDCPEVLADGSFNMSCCFGDRHVIPHRGCILR